MKRIKNNQTERVINDLKTLAIENKVPLWKRIASELEKPTRQRREVNIFKLEKHATDGELVIIPGKLLGTGNLTKKLTVAALSASDSAIQKIKAAKGEVVSLEEMMLKNAKGLRIRIVG